MRPRLSCARTAVDKVGPEPKKIGEASRRLFLLCQALPDTWSGST